MEFEFPPEIRRFRQEIQEFVRSELPTGWKGADEEDVDVEARKAIRKKLAARGWLTLAWPKEYGGREAPHLQQMVFSQEMAYHRVPATDSGISMLGPILMLEGTEEQKATFLPPIARGEVTWAQGYSEPGSGSDLASLQTRAVLDGDDFVVNGTKMWTSFAHYADWLFMLVRTDPDAPRHRGISFLLVDMKSPGVTVRPIIDMAGIHSFNQLFFDNVRVPRRNLVGTLNMGWYVGARLLDFERSGIARAAGAQRTLEELVQFAKETEWNGQPLAKDPMVRHRLASIAIEIEVNRMISYHIGSLQSRGEPFSGEASMARVFGSEMVQRLYQTGMSILGPYGNIAHDSRWAPLHGRIVRGFLTSFSSTIAAGTSEIQRNVIATRGLGLPRG
ncbi:MAG: acyl-CoA dehydrogenase family protein [Chloroflexi bacterium]|nr:acyl-CoA dehydrogenase family protein [Chloroflexota bacterium]